MSNYQFPMLSPEEIVSFFREIIPEMGMTEADLANPAVSRSQRMEEAKENKIYIHVLDHGNIMK